MPLAGCLFRHSHQHSNLLDPVGLSMSLIPDRTAKSEPSDATAPPREQQWRSRTFESFQSSAYRWYWGGMMGQTAAMNMQMVARAWLVYELTDQYIMLGLMMLANAGPMLLLSLFGGVIADRMQKKRILLLGQAASAGVALSVAIAMFVGTISLEDGTGVGFLIATSAVHGLVMGFMMPSRQAIIPELVGSRRLMNAVALNAAGMNINRLAAPGAAGLLIALFGVQTVYLAMTGMYIIAIALIAMLPSTSTFTGRRGAWADLVEGLRYVKNHNLVLALLTLTMLSVSLSMPIMPLMPAFAKDIQIVAPGSYAWIASLPFIGGLLSDLPQLFTESSFRLGLLMSISGVGSLVGSLLVASMRDRNRGAIFLWSTPSLGLLLALYAFTSSFELALLICIGIGLGQSARMALSNGLVQQSVDDEHRGRVMSFYMMEIGVSNVVVFAVAALAETIGIQWAVAGSALLLVPVTLVYYVFIPSVRRLQ